MKTRIAAGATQLGTTGKLVVCLTLFFFVCKTFS